jgi:catechol 2,3-dioxygenase-like lactoylglutathione lyase family enzyme
MHYRISSNIAVRTDHLFDAIPFYTQVLGFENRSADEEVPDLDASPIRLFVIEDHEITGPVMELIAEDLKKADQELIAQGWAVKCCAGAVKGRTATYKTHSG